MRLNRVPMLFDYKEYRGQFLFSTMHSELAFLDAKGHLHLLKSEIQSAILAVFMEREVRAVEFVPRINEPPTPAPVRGLLSGEWYVNSIERLAKAIRG